MSKNIDAIRRGIAAFNRGDWDTAIDLVAEDAVWTTYFGPVAGEKSRYGREAIRDAWEGAAEVFGRDAYQADALKLQDLGGGTVLVGMRLSGRGTSSGVGVATDFAQLWTLRGGFVVRVDSYADVDKALEAAGLSAQDEK